MLLAVESLYPCVQYSAVTTTIPLLLHYYHHGCSLLGQVKPTVTYIAMATHLYISSRRGALPFLRYNVVAQANDHIVTQLYIDKTAWLSPNNHGPSTSYLQSMYRLTHVVVPVTPNSHTGDTPGTSPKYLLVC